MIEHKLLYYPTKLQFLTDLEEKGIAPTSIAFIEDSDTIYTHGHEFVCGGGNGGVILADLDQIKMEIGDDTDSKLQILMDRVNSTISLLATKNFVQSAIDSYGLGLNIQNSVEQILNAKDPSWSVLVSRLASLEGSNQNLNEQIARIEALIQHDDGEYPTITLETIYRLFNEGEDNLTFRNIVAKIFMMANEEGSSITLDADKIYLGNETNQLKLYIRGAIQDALRVNDSSNALTYAQLLATGIKFETADGDKLYLTQNDGLKYTAGRTNPDHAGEVGYQLANDGSGSLAFGNITWDSSGNLTTHGLMLKEAEAMGAANSFIVDSVLLCPTYKRAGVSDFQDTSHFTIINYHICKAGFVIKQGEVRLNSSYFMSAQESNERFVYTWPSNNYGVAANATLYRVGYRAYMLKSITAQSILAAISGTIRDESWSSLIKNSNNEYIFENGDSVYIGFPSQICIVNASMGSEFVGIVDGAEGSQTFENNAEELADEIQNDLINTGVWYSPTYTYCGEYDGSTTYNKNDIVSVITIPGTHGAYFDKNNYLCIKNDVSSAPDPNETRTDNRDWVDCLYDIGDPVLDAAGDLSGDAAAKWTGGTTVTTAHTYTDTSNVTQSVKLYNVESTYQYSVSPQVAITFQTMPISFYRSHIVSWNNSGFSYYNPS